MSNESERTPNVLTVVRAENGVIVETRQSYTGHITQWAFTDPNAFANHMRQWFHDHHGYGTTAIIDSHVGALIGGLANDTAEDSTRA